MAGWYDTAIVRSANEAREPGPANAQTLVAAYLGVLHVMSWSDDTVTAVPGACS